MSSELNGLSKHRQPNGEITYTDRITGAVTKFHTAQCVHCGMWWMVLPGSGRKRGYCIKCPGMLCGIQACMEKCNTIERQLEQAEKKDRDLLKKFGNVPLLG